MDLDQHIIDEARRDHFRRIDRGRGGLIHYGRTGDRLQPSHPTRMFRQKLAPASMANCQTLPLQSVFQEGHAGGFTAGEHDLRSTRSKHDVDLDVLCGRAKAATAGDEPPIERAPRRIVCRDGQWVTEYLP